MIIWTPEVEGLWEYICEVRDVPSDNTFDPMRGYFDEVIEKFQDETIQDFVATEVCPSCSQPLKDDPYNWI